MYRLKIASKADPWTLKLGTLFSAFSTIPAHTKAFSADRATVIPYGEDILINRRSIAFDVETNKRLDPMTTAVLIENNCIMCRINEGRSKLLPINGYA